MLSCHSQEGDLLTCEDNMLFSNVKISCFRLKVHLVRVACCFTCTDASTGESIDLRIYNPNLQMTDKQLRKLVERHRPDLFFAGFQEEVTTKLIQGSTYQKTFFFYKVVECSKVLEVSREIESLITGNS